MGGQRHAPAAGPVWTGAENLGPPPTGYDPRAVQPVGSRYTDFVIPAHTYVLITFVIRINCLSNETSLLLNLRIYNINGKPDSRPSSRRNVYYLSIAVIPKTFFLTDPFCRRKITTDPHILAHVNTECPDDSYEHIQVASHDLTLMKLDVVRFVGTGGFLIIYSNGHTK